jgi:acyl transferase domain-containing protein/NADPH:quinone reductase-like Zn-dependent oxidoreductase
LITDDLNDLNPATAVYGKKNVSSVKVGFVFTGQGAQWPQMGLELLKIFPRARSCVDKLDTVLQRLPEPPKWSLYDELTKPCTPEHARRPAICQPLVTALQIAIIEVFRMWGVSPTSVVGHSSGEIAAAYAARYLTDAEAIVIAYHRGLASQEGRQNENASLGMLAVGLGAEDIMPYIVGSEEVQIACYNSPASVTLSGIVRALEQVKARLTESGVFARMLQVDLAYHSTYMDEIGGLYETLLNRDLPLHAQQFPASDIVTMFSSVTGGKQAKSPDIAYWRKNMTSPVRFEDAVRNMLSGKDSVDFLVEIGPHGALKGPIGQIQRSLESAASNVPYHSALRRGSASIHSTLAVAGQLYLAGAQIDLERLIEDTEPSRPLVVVDLPNYCWNHSTKYWFETQTSKDWRFRPFIHHDLLGSKTLGTSWLNPTFKKTMDLAHLPWLRDHRIGTDVIFPGSGYIAMAVEAIYQTSCMQKPSTSFPLPNEMGYQLRNLRFDTALVLEEDVESVIYLTMNPLSGGTDSWFAFSVSSSREGTTTRHASGLIRVQEPIIELAQEEDIAPLQHTSPGHLWTKACAELGFHYGPAFHLLEEVESRAGKRKARCLITLADPPSAHDPQSVYPVHPAALDGVFRATVPASCIGDRSKVCEALIPAGVDDLIINPTNRPNTGLAVAFSYYSGRGREDAAKSYLGDASVYDPATGALLIRMTGLASHKVDLGVDSMAQHTLTLDALKPDISTLTDEAIEKLRQVHSDMIPLVFDLAVHKKPSLKVLEVDLNTGDLASLWLDVQGKDSGFQHQYRFMALDAAKVSKIESKYADQVNSFQILDSKGSRLGIEGEEQFDLVIVKAISPLADESQSVIQATKGLLSLDGHILVINFPAPRQNGTSRGSLVESIEKMAFARVLSIPCQEMAVFLCTPLVGAEPVSVAAKQVHIVYMEEETVLPRAARQLLEQAGWETTEHQCPAENVPAGAMILVADELWSPILTHISEIQWLCLRRLVTSGCKILWVTRGGQMSVTEPDSALVAGLFRSIRSEDPAAMLMTLDMHGHEMPGTFHFVSAVLNQLQVRQAGLETDSEYVERDGILHVHRVIPYSPLNNEIKPWKGENVLTTLSTNEHITRLITEEVGTLDGLRFVEVSHDNLADNHVEIDIQAAGLNFKDVAVTMGIVPENEHLLGLEGSGIIRRVGPNICDNTLVGTRVVFMAKGAFANRIQVPLDFTHPLPDTMSYQEAATMPVAFCTALYSLFDMGHLEPGQTVLVHSASGGVGIACIQLAKYVGAQIYVTVGSEAKRRFLHETYQIPYNRMFSSRSSKFASDIMKSTNGKGIDVIVNSLTGDLLDATWRVCADGGILVELGKRDMVERNRLSMEPFDRGCSFRAVDLSHPKLLQKLPRYVSAI